MGGGGWGKEEVTERGEGLDIRPPTTYPASQSATRSPHLPPFPTISQEIALQEILLPAERNPHIGLSSVTSKQRSSEIQQMGQGGMMLFDRETASAATATSAAGSAVVLDPIAAKSDEHSLLVKQRIAPIQASPAGTPHCTTLHRTEPHPTALHCTAPHRTAPHCTAPHRT